MCEEGSLDSPTCFQFLPPRPSPTEPPLSGLVDKFRSIHLVGDGVSVGLRVLWACPRTGEALYIIQGRDDDECMRFASLSIRPSSRLTRSPAIGQQRLSFARSTECGSTIHISTRLGRRNWTGQDLAPRPWRSNCKCSLYSIQLKISRSRSRSRRRLQQRLRKKKRSVAPNASRISLRRSVEEHQVKGVPAGGSRLGSRRGSTPMQRQ